MGRLDRKLAQPEKVKKPAKGTPEKLSTDKTLKNFILETVTYLIDCINDR
jgi:hypothetical protein